MHGCRRFLLALFLAWSFDALPRASVLPAATSSLPDPKSSPGTHQPPAAKRAQAAPSSKKASGPRPSQSTLQRRLRSFPRDSGPRVRRAPARTAWLRRLGPSALTGKADQGERRVLEAWKIRAVDGDTFWYGGERVRIRGYDAPERSDPGGLEALQRLEWLLQEGQVVMIPQAVDVYGRTVADVYVDQRSVAEVMVAEGYVKPR